MKILLDTCVWGGAVEVLRSAGHEVVWAGHWDEDPGDMEILSRAHYEGRILVTLDKVLLVAPAGHAGAREDRVAVLNMWSQTPEPGVDSMGTGRFNREGRPPSGSREP